MIYMCLTLFLYSINLIGNKCKLTNENLVLLWEKRLWHISKRIIEKILFKSILDPLDFLLFDVCVNCINGKQTNIKRFGVNRKLNVLELMHICLWIIRYYLLEWLTIFHNIHRWFSFLHYDRINHIYGKPQPQCYSSYDGLSGQRLGPFSEILET